MTKPNPDIPAKKSNPPRFEVADVLFDYGKRYRSEHPVTASQNRIMENIMYCRTAGMGGHVNSCDTCDYTDISYNSCRDRHCPKCQSLNKVRWLETRKAELLPVEYFHNVFTIPHELNDLILYNKKVLLNALFKAVRNTLNDFAENPKHALVGQLGFTSVLHTWNQKMNLHYHLHCIIPAGVYVKEENRWIDAPENFLFPVKALSVVFKAKYVSLVRRAYKAGQLQFPDKIKHLESQSAFSGLLSVVMEKNGIVYSKRSFQSPKCVFDYLGQYTHRVAISNHRIKEIKGDRVRFKYKKRKYKGQKYFCQTEICDLSMKQFISRFLLHELPSGFMRIRHFGFLGSAAKKNRLERIRPLVGATPITERPPKKTTPQLILEIMGIDITRCSKCQEGMLKKVDEFDGIYQRYRFHVFNPVACKS